MPRHTLRVTLHAAELLERFEERLQPTLQAAATLAEEAQRVIDYAPGDANPIVLPRHLFAGLQAAVDQLQDTAGDVFEHHVPDEAEAPA